MAEIEQGMAQPGNEPQPVSEQPIPQQGAIPQPVAQPLVTHQPLQHQHVEQAGQPVAERLVKTFNSWQKVVLALTALLVAAGGLAAAGVKVLQSMKGPTGTVAANTQPGTTQNPLSPHQPPGGNGSGGSGSSSSGKPSSPTPSAAAPVFLGSNSFGIPDEGSVTYSSASGSQNAFAYFGELGDVTAENNVNLVVLDPPAPTASTAYAACEANTDYTSEIILSNLAPGSTFCALTPNDQVLWITLRPSDPNSQSNALNVTVLQWQGPVQDQSGN